MKPEIEALLESYDALIQAKGVDARRLSEIFESRLEDAAARSSVSKDTLREAIRRKYLPWIRAQQKPSSLPPKA